VGSDFVVLGPANPLRHTFKVSRTKRNVQQKKEFVHHGRDMRWICAEKRETDRERLGGGAGENPSSSSPILGFLRKVLKNSYLLVKLCDQLSPLILACS
jgi:hypothetical protein